MKTGRPRQRTVCTLGRLDDSGGQVASLLKGLLRAKGMPASMADTPQVAFESALALGFDAPPFALPACLSRQAAQA